MPSTSTPVCVRTLARVNFHAGASPILPKDWTQPCATVPRAWTIAFAEMAEVDHVLGNAEKMKAESYTALLVRDEHLGQVRRLIEGRHLGARGR